MINDNVKRFGVNSILNESLAHSFWYFTTGSGCCADELLETTGCRYDLERFGCLEQEDPKQSDLLIIAGAITYKAMPELLEIYDEMLSPKFVIAMGACACSGGAFSPELSYSVLPGVDRTIPVDVYIPGCPPRPESIMNGLIKLQEKIRERKRSQTVDC